ncbi:hypothetical protein JCM19298_147 [Nonlabens ulvanivorans]|nr:DUF4349 domain-containing protein [Nonlabens ulvanivorans]GAK94574.1 hypothetical protein JCM19298_147 [Nonlabens ulvanivorans]
MKNVIYVTAIAVILNLSSCAEAYENQASYKEDIIVSSPELIIESPSQSTEKNTQTLENLKIIKNANCRFKVTNLDSASTAAQNLITAQKGYVADMKYTQNDYKLENRIIFKVPATHFESTMTQLTALADFIDFKNISTTDVSDEYFDLQTRLKTKKEVKLRYDEILRGKAKTVEEVLKTEEKLRILQEEIESAEGRLKLLNHKVGYSNIELQLYQTVQFREDPVVYEVTFKDKALSGFKNGWSIVTTLLLILVNIWPLLLLFIAALFFYKRWSSRVRK